MAKLVLSFKGDHVNDYPLDQEILTIGRKPENDIHLDNLAVSSFHAKVLTILNDSFIEDLDSTNGTFIDGNKISKHVLKNGECITVGQYKLEFIDENAKSEENAFTETMIISPHAEARQQTGKNITHSMENITSDLAFASNKNKAPSPAKLELTSGANAGKELKLSKILTTLGKPGVQVAAISRRPGGYYLIVVDAGTDNTMPSVNNTNINKQQLLEDGDLIEVAGVQMRFSFTH